MSVLPPAAAFAHDVRELSRAEHLLLFGFRAVALGHEDCPILHRTFHGLLGPEADGALCNLLVFARVVGQSSARPMRLHAPGCCSVNDSERRLLSALAAAQASLGGGDDRPLRTCMAELLEQPPGEGALMAAQCVAAALTLSGLHLPARSEGVPTPAPTLH